MTNLEENLDKIVEDRFIIQLDHSKMVKKLTKTGSEIFKSLTPGKCNLWHHASCISSEAGELFNEVKQYIIYEEKLDRINVIKELGDIEFYLEGIRQELGINREVTLRVNMLKLKKRYYKKIKKAYVDDKHTNENEESKKMMSENEEPVTNKLSEEAAMQFNRWQKVAPIKNGEIQEWLYCESEIAGKGKLKISLLSLNPLSSDGHKFLCKFVTNRNSNYSDCLYAYNLMDSRSKAMKLFDIKDRNNIDVNIVNEEENKNEST